MIRIRWNGCVVECDSADEAAAFAVAIAGRPFLGDEPEHEDTPSLGREPAATGPPSPAPQRLKRRDGPPKPRGPVQTISPEERVRIGAIVREARKARRLSQEHAARELGVPARVLSALELGKVGKGTGAERVHAALRWAQSPHPADDAPARVAPSKRAPARPRVTPSYAPAPDWKRAGPVTAPLAIELHYCQPYNVRMTKSACERTKAAGREACKDCPGVAAMGAESVA